MKPSCEPSRKRVCSRLLGDGNAWSGDQEKLGELEDPRHPGNGTRHDFREILVIAVCAMLSDADSFEVIALWRRLKTDWLRRFLVLKNGIPSQDTFLRVFQVLDPKQFEAVFRRWVGVIVGALDGMVAVDGKTLRRSADGDAPSVHMIRVFSTELGLVLGQDYDFRVRCPCVHGGGPDG
jgi:hypothetical protein